MKKILFVCHGNICRSPMAEYIFKKMVHDEGLESEFEISSAATSREEIGNDIYPPAKSILRQHGISYEKRNAVQITSSDLAYYDYIIVMEEYNALTLRRLFPNESLEKVKLLMSFAGKTSDVSDPWYTGDFETAFNDISEGCRALLHVIKLEML